MSGRLSSTFRVLQQPQVLRPVAVLFAILIFLNLAWLWSIDNQCAARVASCDNSGPEHLVALRDEVLSALDELPEIKKRVAQLMSNNRQ